VAEDNTHDGQIAPKDGVIMKGNEAAAQSLLLPTSLDYFEFCG